MRLFEQTKTVHISIIMKEEKVNFFRAQDTKDMALEIEKTSAIQKYGYPGCMPPNFCLKVAFMINISNITAPVSPT